MQYEQILIGWRDDMPITPTAIRPPDDPFRTVWQSACLAGFTLMAVSPKPTNASIAAATTMVTAPVNNPRLGIALMILATFIFSVQDGISRLLASEYNVMTVVMLRYWFFALFVIALSRVKYGSVRAVARTKQPVVQIARGVLLVAEICVAVVSFTLIGLVDFHAIFSAYPLMIAALSAPLLGERVGWRRWFAITAGFVGMIIALNPTAMAFNIATMLPVLGTVMFAIYSIMTRYAARKDSAETSFFWTGVAGAVAISFIAPFYWTPPQGIDWLWMLTLCITGLTGHFCMIKALAVTEVSTVQPFAYFSLIFASAVGVIFFDDRLYLHVVLGGSIIVLAGLFTLWRERVAAQKLAAASHNTEPT